MSSAAARRVLAVALVAAACGGTPPERQVLTSFFQASRLRDTTALAPLAAVTFEPRTDGVVRRFEIVDGGTERPLTDAGTIEKRVTIDAEVSLPSGEIVSKPLVVTMRRPADTRRWFITAITPLPASQTSRAGSSARPN